jgi:ATP-dependent RNA helicase DOB1
MINMKNYHPVIVFSFSKRECENNALQLSKMDFNSEDEKQLVGSIYENAIQSLGEDDRDLPQIVNLLPLLKRGIGIHHSGLLPILKEVIEILFQEGLLKILFATETFSIGLNMPAKTVVFTSVKKFDGSISRYLTGGEYIQMSGRAGRRGLDDRGIVILMIDTKMEPDVAMGMLKGETDPLDSAFWLTYTMILSLGRVDGITDGELLKSSFMQFQQRGQVPKLINEVRIYEQRLEQLQVEEEDSVREYYSIVKQLQVLQKDKKDVMTQPAFVVPFLQSGRVILVENFGWGVIVNFHKTGVKDIKVQAPSHILDVLLLGKMGIEGPEPCSEEEGDVLVCPIQLTMIDGLSSVRIHLPQELKTSDARKGVWKIIKEVKKRFNDNVPMLDGVKDMRITDDSFLKLEKVFNDNIEIRNSRTEKARSSNSF